MKQIQLTKGHVALIDDEDYEKVNKFKWHSSWKKSIKSFYATRNSSTKQNCKSYEIQMHRFIIGIEKGDKREVDHINKNTLDNRKTNLRITDKRGNSENRKDQSKYGVGISYKKECVNKYQLLIQINGKTKYIGMFSTPEQAQKIRKDYIDNIKNDNKQGQ